MALHAGGGLAGQDRFVTSDPREAEDRLRTSYSVTGSVRIGTDTSRFRFRQEMAASSGFAISRFQCSSTISYHGPLEGVLCVGHVHAGRLTLDTAHGERRCTTGDVYLVPPHPSWQATTVDIDLATVTLDRDAVARYAAATCGIAPENLVFTGFEPRSPALAKHWVATAAHVRDDILGDPGVAEDPVIVASAFHTLAAGLLSLFPNTALAAISDPGSRTACSDVSTAQLREVVDYLHSHADQPIGPEQWAGVAGAPGSALDTALRRTRGTTAERELWRARLRGVYRDLFEADPQSGVTVDGIAARWGFTTARTFTTAYRAAHGETPGQTLRR